MKFEPDCLPLRCFNIEGSELNMTDALTKYDVPRKLNKYPRGHIRRNNHYDGLLLPS